MADFVFNLVYFEYFLLILVRIATFMFVAPFFNQQGIPAMSKIGVASIVSILVLYTMHPTEELYTSAFGYGVLVIREATTGLIIGFAAYIASTIIVFAGNLIEGPCPSQIINMLESRLRSCPSRVSNTSPSFARRTTIFLSAILSRS